MLTPETSSFNVLMGMGLRIKVVDVGANPVDGEPPYVVPLRAGDADVVGFEPNPVALAELNAVKGPNEVYLPHAIGDGQRHTMHICSAPGMTSLLRPNLAVLRLFHAFPAWAELIGTDEVQTVRLDDIAETEGAQFLKLDVQGAELMVLSHAEERLRNVLVVQSEVEFLQMYADQPLFSDVELFLRSQGFMFHRFFPENSRTIRPLIFDNDIFGGFSQLLWADAVFIRDLTRLERLSDDQLFTMASIVHDLYGSADVALHLLAEHDRRHGTQTGHHYLTAVRVAGTS